MNKVFFISLFLLHSPAFASDTHKAICSSLMIQQQSESFKITYIKSFKEAKNVTKPGNYVILSTGACFIIA